ncbi:sn-glycerol-3-phosphate import ATP-binding protein UgpC [Paraburkholderia caballeronis]|uniref:sn-glycerol-3-phosphate import ATP-binding protein UgpC n=1 Tax=Paraburkholderia caballeronis TaxID=416943 RepID=UPI00106581C9|nr:sn-glycerol-3-phosphate import ATP-binding protein UgpC [Paraburkholderia caballeronis]TDV04991.1 glycerol 3-phosphate ABC transporter ATP-binding protein [Paraburkholderia caballeronis]TDV08159.1 glycerol 3-phosphate ABC transporter ATP-binding protein [Paraburkholderia caballeronis]TDV19128.1 glycerol 3-phosphate ABC transporter ATP-binding protein [Paraburkholderia caballeronis]TDV24021.1 glycerol 3-phosphate ABC transporter ATP-binding protein [Paraburkholderia caballeronis]
MAALTLNGVRKSYDGKATVLHAVNLDVADGEFVVLVGPSGCGKSTLLRMVAGLESVTDGTISIGGRVVNKLEPKDRDIAMVFQNYALYPHMNVAENMAYGLKIRGMERSAIDTRVANAAKILELDKLLERRPRDLSGGQRQRVAMGRAIVREPAVFLFDEPLSNLDAKLRVQMRFEIQRLHQRLRTTSLYVTHDQIEAMTLGHRIVVMNGGHIEQIGVPSEVYEAPASEFVASFIGSPAMNLVKGRVSADRRFFEAATGGPRLPLGEASGSADAAGHGASVVARLEPGRDYTLGIRAEHIAPGGGVSSVSLAVETCELLGADNLAHGRLGGQEIVWRLPAADRPSIGAQVEIALPPERLHFFDSTTGLRV